MGSKRELIETIDKQQEKLSKYEVRLRDVVRAYKGLQKEKEALEATLNALTTNKVSDCRPHSGSESLQEDVRSTAIDKEKCTENEENNGCSSDLQCTTNQNDETSTNQLQHQISVLTQTLSTLTAEKARIETSFQADKKRLMHEKEECEKNLELEKLENNTRNDSITREMVELRNKLKNQQQEREKEESNHALMLREIQKLVSIERMSKERLQEKLDDVQSQLQTKEKKLGKTTEYEKRLAEMAGELKMVTERLQLSEETANRPSPMLIDLQNQMSEMKAQHSAKFEKEKLRANEAEKKLSSSANASESRVAALELKLSELSNLVGNYDRLRCRDQMEIAKLKQDRVSQLDPENSALDTATSKAISPSDIISKPDVEDSELGVQELIDRISRFKNLLWIANQKAEIPVNLKEIFKDDIVSAIQSPVRYQEDHSKCEMEVKKIREEFERYKARVQIAMKNKNSKDNSNEVNQLADQISQLQNTVAMLRSRLDEDQNAYEVAIEEAQSYLAKTENLYEKKIKEKEVFFKIKLQEIEERMMKQRGRSIAIIEEKQAEVDSIRNSKIKLNGERQKKLSTSSDCGESVMVATMLKESRESLQNEAQMLHYQQEISRLGIEVKSLRKLKHSHENTLRELQSEISFKETKYTDEINELSAKFSRVAKSHDRSLNLEYLKNVVLNFIGSSDPIGRLHMVNAIAAVLHFTPKELTSVRHQLS